MYSRRAVLLVLAATVSVQVGGAFAVILITRVGPAGAVLLRTTLAALLVVAWCRPRLRNRSRTDWVVAAGFGLILAMMNLCFYEAAARLPLGAAVTLEFLGPLGVAVATSRRLRDLLWVVLAGTGVVLLSEGALNGLNPSGVAFALGAATCWAAYILVGVQAGRRFPGMEGLAVALVVASLAVAPVAVVTSDLERFTPTALLLGLGVAMMSSAIPYSLEIAALRRLPARTFGVLMSIEPAIATLAAFVILGQRLTPWQLLAVAMVVVASAGATRSTAPT